MLARRVASILPPLSLEEAIEASTVWSVAGLLAPGQGLLSARPFRSPHHTASEAGLIGGGGVPHPGEISLAHHGVLFLDELPEFSTRVLEALRQPLEDARVVVSRSAGTVVFPARFQLVAAANPCRRGCASLPTCACAPPERARYLGRLSRPLLDRIDLHLEIPALSHADLTGSPTGEPSAAIRARVVTARARQVARFAGTAIHANARMSGRQTRRVCPLPPDAARLLGLAVFSDRGEVSLDRKTFAFCLDYASHSIYLRAEWRTRWRVTSEWESAITSPPIESATRSGGR